ncbi:MAG: hypothetical protein AVO38_08745 [delta proteobacterium ML8_D]|jgi:flagellar basal-body rod protein FlgB|nr:MAG: hypothetical protein AVO38_08745 [delta proteobacterium ML8_D]
MGILFNKTIEMLSTILNFQSKRHKVITSNIANIDTPGYKTKELVFKQQLENLIDDETEIKMTKTDQRHLSKQPSHVFEVINSEEEVKIDDEMVKLAENNFMYNLTVELMARKFRGLDNVLKEAK